MRKIVPALAALIVVPVCGASAGEPTVGGPGRQAPQARVKATIMRPVTRVQLLSQGTPIARLEIPQAQVPRDALRITAKKAVKNASSTRYSGGVSVVLTQHGRSLLGLQADEAIVSTEFVAEEATVPGAGHTGRDRAGGRVRRAGWGALVRGIQAGCPASMEKSADAGLLSAAKTPTSREL